MKFVWGVEKSMLSIFMFVAALFKGSAKLTLLGVLAVAGTPAGKAVATGKFVSELGIDQCIFIVF